MVDNKSSLAIFLFMWSYNYFFVLIITVTGCRLLPDAVKLISPATSVDCMITWHFPLNKERCQLLSKNLSGSWLLGSPLPTPIIFALPNKLNLILFIAV